MKECKLIIRDEVNVKLEGLELGDRKTLMKMFEFEVPGARYLPAVRLGRWNGKSSFFALGGSTYINLLPEILPLLDQAGYDIELDDTRDYQTTFTFTEVSEDTFKHKNWPVGHPMVGQPIILRDYQIEIINNYLKNPQNIDVNAELLFVFRVNSLFSATAQWNLVYDDDIKIRDIYGNVGPRTQFKSVLGIGISYKLENN